MKNMVFMVLFVMIGTAAYSQSSRKTEIKENRIVELQGSSSTTTVYSGFTFVEKNGNEYPVYVTSNGRCYYNKVSKKGNEYKKYLDEQTSRELCRLLNIEYKEKKS